MLGRRPTKAETLREAVMVLQTLVPLPYPVSVRRARVKEAWGDCELNTKNPAAPKFYIRIARSIDEDAAIATLAHEWAHARSWLEHTQDHGPYWGIAFSECYQALYEE